MGSSPNKLRTFLIRLAWTREWLQAEERNMAMQRFPLEAAEAVTAEAVAAAAVAGEAPFRA